MGLTIDPLARFVFEDQGTRSRGLLHKRGEPHCVCSRRSVRVVVLVTSCLFTFGRLLLQNVSYINRLGQFDFKVDVGVEDLTSLDIMISIIISDKGFPSQLDTLEGLLTLESTL